MENKLYQRLLWPNVCSHFNTFRRASSHPPLPRSKFLYTSNHTITLLISWLLRFVKSIHVVARFYTSSTLLLSKNYNSTSFSLGTTILTLLFNCRYQAPPPPLLLDTDITRGWLSSGERYAEYNHRHTYKFTIWCGLTRESKWVNGRRWEEENSTKFGNIRFTADRR